MDSVEPTESVTEAPAEAAVELAVDEPETTGDLIQLETEMDLVSLSVPERRIGLRIVPYGVVATHPAYGPIMFERGAFDPVEPREVRLRMDHENPPTGIGTGFSESDAGAFMDFQLSKTQRADEQLRLAKDGVSRGTSPGFLEIVGKAKTRRIGGQDVKVYGPGSARLMELSTTWIPTFSGDGVVYALNREQKGEAPVAETQEAPAVGAQIDYDRMAETIAEAVGKAGAETKLDAVLAKFDEMMELQRASFKVPEGETKPKAKLADWVGVTLRRMAGEQVSPTELKTLALDDIITTEQPGLVPATLVPDYDDVIDQSRPFLTSTRQVSPPRSGTSMLLPLLTSRATAGTQAGGQKTEVTTGAMKVGTGTFAYQAVFGAADVSIQMLLRAEQSFMDLLTAEFGEAYALDCDTKAISALITGYTDSASAAHVPTDGGVMDPEDPDFGSAFKNSVAACKRRPTHIWLSVDGVAAFINAKAPVTNAPLYSNLAAAFTAGGGPGGTVSGLIPIYVPALDDLAVDVIIGPSRGFVWAEDPAIRLQADNVANLGRDFGLAGGIFPAPRYADAFTTYTVAS